MAQVGLSTTSAINLGRKRTTLGQKKAIVFCKSLSVSQILYDLWGPHGPVEKMWDNNNTIAGKCGTKGWVKCADFTSVTCYVTLLYS